MGVKRDVAVAQIVTDDIISAINEFDTMSLKNSNISEEHRKMYSNYSLSIQSIIKAMMEEYRKQGVD